ncbi:TetR/AcrR family transcriptional regulator C-terminal domain-containing protein [soil metagenome]
MNVTQGRARARPRVPLTEERVLQAAIELADVGGIGTVTMRRLGQALGVEAMSLYNHVANKDAILVGIIDAVVGSIDLPSSGSDWKAAMRQSAISAHEVLVGHPWAPGLLVTRMEVVGPARWRQMDAMLGCLRQAGFSIEMTHHAFHVLDTYILGFTVQEVSFPCEDHDLGALASLYLRKLPADAYPHLAEHVTYHIESNVFDEGDFEFGLDLVLDGLERLRATA